MKITKLFSCSFIAALAIAAFFAAGCATQKTTKKVYYFFPPPPDEARLQFLTSFGSEKEFRGGDDKTFMTFLTGSKPLRREISKPYGVAVHDKKLYVCDTDFSTVIIVDLQSRRMRLLPAEGEGALKLPLNITLDNDGTIYVADSVRDQVVIFDKNESYVAAMGKAGEMKPRDVAVSKDRIYVADLMTRKVRVFDKTTRAPLFEFPSGSDATNHLAELLTPTNLALDSKGRIYVGDTGGFHVQVFDADGKYLRTIGEFGDAPGQFARVKGVATDRENRIYAVDAMSQVIQIFNDEGSLLTWFGDPTASKATQNLPAKVMVDYDNAAAFQSYVAPGFKVEHLVFVINQLGTHKVSVYGFGHKK
jgi:DNA-binding beta-propeller fold protein YncE